MTKFRIAALALAAAVFFSLASCQEFFTSSWGGWAERDASVPSDLTAAQAMDISDTALQNRDTDLARALLPQMADFLAGAPSDELAAAAVDTAVLATGIDDAFGEALKTLGTDVIEGGGSLTPAQIDALAAILNSITVDADAVAVFTYLEGQSAADMAAAGVTAADYAMAATALLIAEVGDAAILSNLIDTDFAGYTPGANAALASDLIANASAQWPGDALLDAMSDMFDAL